MRLIDICDFQGGSQPPKEEWTFEKKNGYIRMLQIRDFTQREKVVPEYIKLGNTTKICESDDILIARYGASIGKILTGLAGAYNVAMMRVIPDTSKIKKRYLYYYMKSTYFQNTILNVGSRAEQAGFNKEDLSSLEIECPSLSKQDDIIRVLSKIESVIDKRKEEIGYLDVLIKARFVELFGNEKHRMMMSEVCSIITDGTHQPPKFKREGIPFIFVSNIAEDRLTYNAEKFIDQETYDELIKRTPIEIGDVLLSTVGSYGHPAVVKSDKKFLFQRHIAYLKPRREIVDSEFLHGAILSSGVQAQIEKAVKGIAQKTLNLSEIKKMVIPVPTMDMQKHFAAFVAEVDKSKYCRCKSRRLLQRVASI